MILFGLLLMVVGLAGSLYLHGYGVELLPINMTEVWRRNLITAFIACLVVGIVITVIGVLLP